MTSRRNNAEVHPKPGPSWLGPWVFFNCVTLAASLSARVLPDLAKFATDDPKAAVREGALRGVYGELLFGQSRVRRSEAKPVAGELLFRPYFLRISLPATILRFNS